MKEGESLLLMFLGIHSFCYDTTPFSKKILSNHFDQESCLSANNMSGNVSLLWMENGGARTCSLAHVVGVSTDDSRAEN